MSHSILSQTKAKKRITTHNCTPSDNNSQVPVLDMRETQDLTCKACNASFASKTTLFHHLAHGAHAHLPQVYKCPNCTYTTPSRTTFHSHLQGKHRDQAPMILHCQLCNYSTHTIRHYKKHRRTHHCNCTTSTKPDHPTSDNT